MAAVLEYLTDTLALPPEIDAAEAEALALLEAKRAAAIALVSAARARWREVLAEIQLSGAVAAVEKGSRLDVDCSAVSCANPIGWKWRRR